MPENNYSVVEIEDVKKLAKQVIDSAEKYIKNLETENRTLKKKLEEADNEIAYLRDELELYKEQYN